MRWSALGGVAAVLVTGCLLAGCGGGDDPDPAAGETTPMATATAPTGTAPAAPALDPAEALLALADFPTGWTQEPSDPDDDEGEDTFCGKATDNPDPIEEAGAKFAAAQGVPQVEQEVAVFPEDVAERVFAEGRQRVADCTGFTEEGVTYELAPLSFPALGDESFAALLRFSNEGFDFAGVVSYTRVGPALMIVTTAELAPATVAQAERYARLAAQRLEEAAGG
jgi:hypothetical protein